jgi:FSR family fosmidomycin resistance protein-like MFS transporter
MNEKQQILSTVIFFHAVNDGSLAVITILLPIFKTLFDLNYTQIGVITGGGLAITLLTEMTVGRWFDKKNSRTLLLTGIFMLSITMFLLSFSFEFVSLLLIIFFIKFSSGFFHPAGIGLISRVFKKDRIDRAMGIQSASGNFGSFIAIFTTLAIAVRFGWTMPLYLWSVIGFICVFVGFSLTRRTPTTYLMSAALQGQRQTAKKALKEWYSIISRLKLLIPLFAVSITTYSIVLSYLPLFLDEKTSLSLSMIGLIMALWIGVGVIASLLFERIQSSFQRKTLLILTYFTIGIIGLTLTVTTVIPLIIVFVILLGIATFLSFPALFSVISGSTQEKNEGKTFGYIFTLQLAVGTFLLFISGALADIFGIWIPFTILGIIGFAATIILLVKPHGILRPMEKV